MFPIRMLTKAQPTISEFNIPQHKFTSIIMVFHVIVSIIIMLRIT